MISGFSTTGASILSDVEVLSHCSLLWRSFTHWIGGMGVLVFLLAVIPLSGGSDMNLMRAETTGPSVGKLVPKVKQTARILYIIYIGLTAVYIVLLLLGKMPLFDAQNGVFEGITHATFQVAAVITSTGFFTQDFDQWSQTCKTILVLLMFIGSCAGSTSCGLKVSRCIILVKTILKEMTSYIHPKSIKKIKFEDRPVEHEVVRACNVYFISYILVFSLSFVLISLEGKDFSTTFTSTSATLNNTGPGLSYVGPIQNYGHFSFFSKYVMMFNMLAGRLELFPILMLFHPAIWKELVSRRYSKK